MNVLILGGRGFVGHAVHRALREHYTITTFDRHAGGTSHRQGDITEYGAVKRAVEDQDIVINLIGLSPVRQPSVPYADVHVRGIDNVITAADEIGVSKIIHNSALGADPQSSLAYLRTKGQAEERLLRSKIPITIFQPSLIFGKNNELVQMAGHRFMTAVFPRISAHIQPIYRHDIASLMAQAIEGGIAEERLEIGGPETMTVYLFVTRLRHMLGYPTVPVPLSLAKLGLYAAALLPLSRIGREQIAYLEKDNIPATNQAPQYCELMPYTHWVTTTYAE